MLSFFHLSETPPRILIYTTLVSLCSFTYVGVMHVCLMCVTHCLGSNLTTLVKATAAYDTIDFRSSTFSSCRLLRKNRQEWWALWWHWQLWWQKAVLKWVPFEDPPLPYRSCQQKSVGHLVVMLHQGIDRGIDHRIQKVQQLGGYLVW